MSTARIGPTLAIVASCEGCAHRTATKIGGRRSGFARCVHPSNKRDAIFSSNAPTPAWCPELPSARLAMAREIVAEAPPSKADDRWYGGFIAALATIARYPAGMTAKGIMQDHGVTIADLRDSQQGVPQEIDDIEASR